MNNKWTAPLWFIVFAGIMATLVTGLFLWAWFRASKTSNIIDAKCQTIWSSYSQLKTLPLQTNIDWTRTAFCQSKDVLNDKGWYDTKEVTITPTEYYK